MITLPDTFQDKHIGILGTTGAGKTSVTKVAIVEPLLSTGRRVHIIDPKLDWWGLRLAADGKAGGFKIYIFGGQYGDYPLRVADAAPLAEAFASSSDSAIFCTQGMTVEERSQFFIKYAETILRKNRGPLNLIIDEAHLFMPQAGSRAGGLAPRMLHAGNELMSTGRSMGFRIALVTQRPQKLHKDSLTLVQALIALRMMHPLDRGAIEAWMVEQADPKKGAQIMDSLGALKAGEAWAWSPVDHFLKRIQFPMPRTFDSSKAPEMGDTDVPVLEPINLEALTGKLAQLAEEKAANDPKTLKAEIARLNDFIRQAASTSVSPEMIREAQNTGYSLGIKDGAKDGFAAGFRKGAEMAAGDAQDRVRALAKDFDDLPSFEDALPRALETYVGYFAKSMPSPVQPVVMHQSATAVGYSKPRPPAAPKSLPATSGGLNGRELRIVNSLNLWRTLGHERPSREQVAAIAGYSVSSGSFRNILGALRSAGLIDYPSNEPGRVILVQAAGETPTMDDARRMMLEALNGRQHRLIEALPRNGSSIGRDQLGARTDYSATSGSFRNILGSLRTLGMIDYPNDGEVALTGWASEILA